MISSRSEKAFGESIFQNHLFYEINMINLLIFFQNGHFQIYNIKNTQFHTRKHIFCGRMNV